MSGESFGKILRGPQAVGLYEVWLYEQGLVVKKNGKETEVPFSFPIIGRPNIPPGPAVGASLFEEHAISLECNSVEVTELGEIVRLVLGDCLCLLPSAQGGPTINVSVNAAEPSGTPNRYNLRVTSSSSLQERQIYDVALRDNSGNWHVVAPNAVYYRSSWSDFGIAHITDMHVARRIDWFRARLEQWGRTEAANKFCDWNDRFRGFVRYANFLHDTGLLDVIVATGDLIDYIWEVDDNQSGGGNAEFLRDLILGKAPGVYFPEVERLRVPIFMVPGNHDYRANPYRLVFDAEFLGKNVSRVKNYSGYHLLADDAIALSRGDNTSEHVPGVDEALARRMLAVHAAPYCPFLWKENSYVVKLGKHRIVMLNSGPDVGIIEGKWDAFATSKLGWGGEDKQTFVGGSPNCEGVSAEEFAAVKDALSETPNDGLFIVGIHAPLINIWNNAFSYYLRETQRESLAGQVRYLLLYHDFPNLKKTHPDWMPSASDSGEPSFVKRGTNDDLLDWGVSRGHANELLRVLAGIGTSRKADVVLAGHTHLHNEFRIGTDPKTGEVAYFFDFYTYNPRYYYPTRFFTGHEKPTVPTAPDKDATLPSGITYLEISAHAAPGAKPWPMPHEAIHRYRLTIPPYGKPLASAPDPKAWWEEHRPLILQTGALGPLENSQVSFSGFRVLTVRSDVIDKIHFVSIERLERHNFRLPWEEAIKVEPERHHIYLERSRPIGSQTAAGAGCGVVVPGTGMTTTVYRGTDNHLHELWKSASDRGRGNLTTSANATPASGDPSIYLNTRKNELIVPYRGTDGHVHSLYWTTGAVGHDRLSETARAPKAAGNPVGYYAHATDEHHVIYRASDGHLHSLYWIGIDVVRAEDLTALAASVPAIGDPAAYLDTLRGENVVVYAGTDRHIHSLYWSTGAVGHDNLSAVAQAPTAMGRPFAYYTPHNNAHQVVYRSADGHLRELWWTGQNPVSHWDLTAAAGGPPAVSDAVAYYNAATNTKQVVYRTADNHLHVLWWVPGGGIPSDLDLTLYAMAPPSVDMPWAFSDPSARTQHVLFRGDDKHIHEIYWS